MKSYDLYAKLELITPDYEQERLFAPRTPSIKKQFAQFVSRIGQALLNYFSGNNELRVAHRCDRHGHSYYEIYDPRLDKVFCCQSEQEVRAWIEQRYYQD